MFKTINQIDYVFWLQKKHDNSLNISCSAEKCGGVEKWKKEDKEIEVCELHEKPHTHAYFFVFCIVQLPKRTKKFHRWRSKCVILFRLHTKLTDRLNGSGVYEFI